MTTLRHTRQLIDAWRAEADAKSAEFQRQNPQYPPSESEMHARVAHLLMAIEADEREIDDPENTDPLPRDVWPVLGDASYIVPEGD